MIPIGNEFDLIDSAELLEIFGRNFGERFDEFTIWEMALRDAGLRRLLKSLFHRRSHGVPAGRIAAWLKWVDGQRDKRLGSTSQREWMVSHNRA